MASIGVTGAFGETNTCGTSLAASASCTVSVDVHADRGRLRSRHPVGRQQRRRQPVTVALTGTGTSSANTNLALDQPVTASGYTQDYVPANAVDGNTSTYWESTDNAFPQWFQVDLGSATSVSRIVMDLPPSTAWATRTQTITVQGSTDGTNYTTLAGSAGYTFNPATGNTVTITFTAILRSATSSSPSPPTPAGPPGSSPNCKSSAAEGQPSDRGRAR